jgi:hypothetical protein
MLFESRGGLGSGESSMVRAWHASQKRRKGEEKHGGEYLRAGMFGLYLSSVHLILFMSPFLISLDV